MDTQLISVIVPVHNGAATLPRCLEALLRALDDSCELIVVDDRSTDRTADAAAAAGVQVIANTHARGPAGARNAGAAQARGSVFLFVDADVVVPPDTIAKVRAGFDAHPDAAAVFGSYDRDPAEPNFLSQYKNLFHHFVHQISREQSSSFWAGCGAVRREAFEGAQGFDEKTYPEPSVEDIDLGARICARGSEVRLIRDLQVKHLKRWTPAGLLRADIFLRALPWTRLIAESGRLPDDLNLQQSQRVSAVLAWVFVASAAALGVSLARNDAWTAGAGIALAASGLALLWLNRGFYSFFVRLRGVLFTAGVFCWHVLYFLYSSAVFAVAYPCYRIRRSFRS